MSFYYQAFGIFIVSEIELPSLAYADPNFSETPVSVNCGFVEQIVSGKINEQEFKYEISEVARYYIKNGTDVIIEPLCDNWEEILLYFYSNCLAVILFQRNLTPFHVSGIFLQSGNVLLFAAPSGTGKSTTAMMLHQRGYAPFTDDTAVLTVEGGNCYAQASYPMMRLWQNSIDLQPLLHQEDQQFIRSDAEMDKFGFHFHDNFVSEKVKVVGIVFLEAVGEMIQIEQLKPIEGLALLLTNIYRGHWQSAMKKGRQQFEISSKICQTVPVFKASRPENKPSFDAYSEAIESQIIKIINQNYIKQTN